VSDEEMITAGVDIGSATTKAAIMEDNRIISWSLMATGDDSEKVAGKAVDRALAACRKALSGVQYIVATGYGRVNAPFANRTITEISCHAKGIHWFFPSVRTILDMGGQDCKAIRCESGKTLEFIMNDKCAAGTGRHLVRVAAILGISLQEMGELSLQVVEQPARVSSTCTIFAENDIVALISQGTKINDVLAGVCESIVERMLGFLGRLGKIERDVSICGGVAKNVGITSRLEARLGFKCVIPAEPQIVGAVGAAIFASEEIEKRRT
jgi:predicted CoA-substrate-specific enzyme activase